jgi:catechol 2,3-dioxygenase-like lactoylglutathione lyase family enzyme
MRISVTNVFVDDQQKVLRFYTEILGFAKKTEIPLGEFLWLTEGVRSTQLPLEAGAVVTAVLDDNCGNLIQIAAAKGA